jgi:hypothetical protein
MTAIDLGLTGRGHRAKRLMEESTKARENGEGYALATAQTAATAVQASAAFKPRADPACAEAEFGMETAIAGKADILCSRDGAFQSENVRQVCATHGIRLWTISVFCRSFGGVALVKLGR